MAVQKSRKSHSKTRMKRMHSGLTPPPISIDQTSGEVHLRHHVTKLGYLKGKKALNTQKTENQATISP